MTDTQPVEPPQPERPTESHSTSAVAVFNTLWGVFTIVVTATGALIGFGIGQVSREAVVQGDDKTLVWYWVLGLSVASALLFFLLSQFFFRRLVGFISYLERVAVQDKIAAAIGVLLGALIAYLATAPFAALPGIGTALRLFALVVCVTLGVVLTMSAKEQLGYIFPRLAKGKQAAAQSQEQPVMKFLDTNVIIDGRIADIYATGFLAAPLYVPGFILAELQSIADSADPLKRARGRRGLEVLDRIRNDLRLPVEPFEDYPNDYDESEGVDIRLVKVARACNGAILTNDYNLNKIAGLHRVPVLNVNELANAVKPVFLPGEKLQTTIVKEGNQPGQGVGYLDDGTMVVVEHASRLIGRTVLVTVASTYQTNAGKMLFTELAEDSEIPDVPRRKGPGH